VCCSEGGVIVKKRTAMEICSSSIDIYQWIVYVFFMQYLSITEAAIDKDVSRQAIFSEIKAGRINAIRIGHQHAILNDVVYKRYEPNRNIQRARIDAHCARKKSGP